jgi:hypothetical protein
LAIYHLSIKIITRGEGKSAVAAAAYRAGETIKNEYDGIAHDYSRKGGIIHTEILLPKHAPVEYADRAVLWNAVEKIEKQCNSQLAREIEIALPAELTKEQNISLAHRFVKEQFVDKGMCADICMHVKGDGNPHAHILLTMRPIETNGKWGAKIRKVNKKPVYTTDWNDRDKAEEWRKAWAAYANAALRLAGKLTEENVLDHRSYERQGLEMIPTVHLGAAAMQMEKRGFRTWRGDMNRRAEFGNKELRQLTARIKKLEKWIAEEKQSDREPDLADLITASLDPSADKSNYKRIVDIKLAAKALSFVQKNDIKDIAALKAAIHSIRSDCNDKRAQLVKVEHRMEKLEEYFSQAEVYAESGAVVKKANGMVPKKQEAYRRDHEADFIKFEAAHRFFTGVLNGRTTIPIPKWKAEYKQLEKDRVVLQGEYRRLKEDVAEAEAVKRCADALTKDEPTRGRKREEWER